MYARSDALEAWSLYCLTHAMQRFHLALPFR
jgi:hypothetical protein